MKYIIVLGDGMADEPVDELGGLTPLEAADTPVMDRLAAEGCCGLVNTVPPGFHPGSEIANMEVLGYDVSTSFEGRGVLEAASMGVDVPDGWMAMRCNLITIAGDCIKNHSGGHISTDEASRLIAALEDEFGSDDLHFYPGVSYRHLLLIRGGDKRIECTPPHDVPGTPYRDVLVRACVPEAQPTADLLNSIILRSRALLEGHPVNRARLAEGHDMANSIWPWSPGYRPAMRPMSDTLPIRNGKVISAVDLIFGIGIYAGLEPLKVEGATGLFDTNYEGKIQAAIDALRGDADFVFLHVEASDEAGHEGDVQLKKRTIEYLDSRILRPLVEALPSIPDSVSIAVLPDHPTPCRLRTHTSAPVPFLIWRPDGQPDSTVRFSEREAAVGCYGTIPGTEFIRLFVK